MLRILSIISISILFSGTVCGQTQKDTIFCYQAKTPVTIDGQATEDCWINAEWHAIDQVWIPWAAKMKEGDFEGRFKVAWDESYLYVLVEVVDDSLSDDHTNPLQNWWDDDCLEVFIDENRSKGDHERNCNAFAYHVSITYDAVDLNASGGGVNYKNNLKVDMDTIGAKTYLWEFAFENYNANFNISNPEASRVYLTTGKKMGFTIAYCDNDETTSRENFIGSMVMTQATANDMYKNADYFGLMILSDSQNVTSALSNQIKEEIKIYPVPARNFINIETSPGRVESGSISILSVTGQLIKTEYFSGFRHTVNIENMKDGLYLIKVVQGNNSFSRMISKK